MGWTGFKTKNFTNRNAISQKIFRQKNLQKIDRNLFSKKKKYKYTVTKKYTVLFILINHDKIS